ncbi:hypothetical protein MERGE_000928 [Pneumocystis wakefieldiae]|uniref:Uncharacterized protein n=1 Tax=Pneumocystis wakefieldiae TaxID=38082 RepID=A0A899G5G6_9ASCO|nr:hypothetical protein MERGE_000928 [Pneumocystis wakefieldiae]
MISNYPHKNGSFYLDNDSIKRIENIMMLVHEFRSMISNVGRLSYEHEGVIEINNRNKIFKEDVIKFKNIIQNMIGMKSLSLNDLNNGSLNVHSKFVNSELVLHLRLEKSYLDSFKQMSRIKWLEKQQDIISKRLKSEKYLQNASNCVQKKDIERLRDIQNELKLVRSFQKNAI